MIARFNFHDVDNSGTRTESDFKTVINNLVNLLDVAGSERESQIAAAIMAEWDVLKTTADLDDDGAVSKEEFLAHCDRMISDQAVFDTVSAAASKTLFDLSLIHI